MFDILVAPLIDCQELLNAGITADSYFVHYQTGENPEVWHIALKGTETGYKAVPAWTKEELDVMIGPDWPKPDFTKAKVRTMHSDVLEYSITFPTKMMIYKTGTRAAAAALLFLIKNDHVNAGDASQRWFDFFFGQ